MTPEEVDEAATLLTQARLSISTLPSLKPHEPLDLRAANRIADSHAKQLGWDVTGWKVGSTSAVAMQILGSSEPFAGRVFDGTVYGSRILDFDAIHEPLIESEFAFVLGQALPPRNERYSLEDVRAATVAICPALEFVTSRLAAGLQAGVFNIIADSGSNAGVVLGDPVPVNECPPLSTVTAELTVGGERVVTGSGADILGDPWRSLEWLANHLSDRQIGLEAGQFVMSGTCTGIQPLPGGATATATFAGMGEVTVSRTASS